jgi:trehalose/maltose hydrolase-like predicted phosphorylase
MDWILKESEFSKSNIELNGSKFLIANGYMGYRGTLEEFRKQQLVACTLSGVYDRVGDGWREPINAPNGFFTSILVDGEVLDVFSDKLINHEQILDIKNGVHRRKSVFKTANDNKIEINIERFLSADDIHLGAMRCGVKSSKDCKVTIITGIDSDVWDINGPHLVVSDEMQKGNSILVKCKTQETGCDITVAEELSISFGCSNVKIMENLLVHEILADCIADTEYTFTKYISVFTGRDNIASTTLSALECCEKALDKGYDELYAESSKKWEDRWKASDVVITGDEEAQFALRYSIYHLLAIAPTHTDNISIPARGLSGQVYKGGIFWDTEMFMLPFFVYTNPSVARNLVKYRCNTLDGARRKAKEYGYKGAFYAWESQDTGDDACTLFNITDIHTGRPMRTYFRDRQVHVSADAAYGIWNYFLATGDESILFEGGAEVIFECASFYLSYAYFKKDKNRYEILNVVGPDEYHERVDNNAYTNMMVKFTMEAALKTAEILKSNQYLLYRNLCEKLSLDILLEQIEEMNRLLYVPEPSKNSLLIEQFDGYSKLEDISQKALKERVIIPNEYLGGANGLATTTQILKQADVIMMLNVFKDRYSEDIKNANWQYYEPRTEHGSSLSHCAYAIVAADLGEVNKAYEFFMKTATVDLTGKSKQYLGSLYIGGTHPAANGGAWLTAIYGFAGLRVDEEKIELNPHLPMNWKALSFNISWRGKNYEIHIDGKNANIQLVDN